MSVFRSGFTVAFFTLLSRIFGLLRELCLAYIFGSSQVADCINVALKLPNLFRRIFGEGALASVFIPIYNKKMVQSQTEAGKFASDIFSLLLCTLTLITLLMQIFMPQIMLLLAPGFYQSDAKFNLSVFLCRITMPYLIFISTAALFGGMLNSVNRFKAFAATPIILNIVIILGCFVNSELVTKPVVIAFAILISGILQAIFMYYSLKSNNLDVGFSRSMLSGDSKYLLKQMLPAVISAGMIQISLFVSQSLASFIDGAISIISYAERIYQLPLSLIGTAFGTVLLPELSKLYNNKDLIAASRIQENAIQFGLYISLACATGMAAVSDLIIEAIYQRGAFTQLDTILTSSCLIAFSGGLPAFILNKILTPIFYANNDTQTPLKITAYSLLANLILNIIFMNFYGAAGIAIGSSLSAWLNAYLLFSYVRKRFGLIFTVSMRVFVFKVLIANLTMATCVILAKYLIYYLHPTSLSSLKLIILLGLISFGAIVYFVTSLLIGLVSKGDISQFKRIFLKKL